MSWLSKIAFHKWANLYRYAAGPLFSWVMAALLVLTVGQLYKLTPA
jgi:hypothetical protein